MLFPLIDNFLIVLIVDGSVLHVWHSCGFSIRSIIVVHNNNNNKCINKYERFLFTIFYSYVRYIIHVLLIHGIQTI